MQNIQKKFFWGIVLSVVIALPLKAGLYKQEFEALKQERSIVFSDRDPFVNDSLISLQRDIENYKELGLLGRLARFPFMLMGGFVVTAESMPKLYGYIDTMCKKHNIKTPTIFVSTEKGFFNAAASKLFIRAYPKIKFSEE